MKTYTGTLTSLDLSLLKVASAVLLTASMLALSFAPIFPNIAFAVGELTSIDITDVSPTVEGCIVAGTEITVSGTATADAPPGNLSQYHVQIDWGAGITEDETEQSPFGGNTQGVETRSFSGTHTYNTVGTTTITARIYHQTVPGNDGAADAVESIEVCVAEEESETGSITIEKEVIGDDAEDWSFDFTGDIGSFMLSSGGDTSTTTENLGEDTYTITETSLPDGWTLTEIDCDANDFATTTDSVDITLGEGEDVTCTFTNSFEAPEETVTITVVKAIAGDFGEAWEFDFDWDDLLGGEFSLSGLSSAVTATTSTSVAVVGETYTIAEVIGDLPEGWSPFGVSCVGAAAVATTTSSAEVEVGESGIICTFTNSFEEPTATTTGSLKLIKETVDGDGIFGFDLVGTLGTTSTTSITTSGGSGFWIFDDLLAGFYSVFETLLPSVGWSETSNTCSEVEVVAGTTTECVIENTFTSGGGGGGETTATLTLVKEVINDDGGSATTTDWTLDADGPEAISGTSGSEEVTEVTVEAGVYTLSESGGPDGYTASSWSCEGGSLSGNELTLEEGESALCTITNDDEASEPPAPQCSDGIDNDDDGLTDSEDPACHTDGDAGNSDSYDPELDDESDDPDSGNSGSGTSSTGGGGGGGVIVGLLGVVNNPPAPQVLGAFTGPEASSDAVCQPYLLEYIRFGGSNNPAEVFKLQRFLRDIEGFVNLPETGIYGNQTHAAVHTFQLRYMDSILTPWGATRSTGYVYYTTQKTINEIYCEFTRKFPLSQQQLTEIARVRALGESAFTESSSAASSPSGASSEVQDSTSVEVDENGTEETTEQIIGFLQDTTQTAVAAEGAEQSRGFWGTIGDWFRSIFGQ